MSTTDEVHANPRLQRLALIAVCMGMFMMQLDATVVNVALTKIGADLHASVSDLQWVVDAYVLPLACLLLIGGRLGDRFGHRRVFVAGLAVFAVGSALCALATTSSELIAARVLQGIGAALELPATLAILAHTYPQASERERAIGIWAGVAGLSLAIGPVLGGSLVDTLGWQSVFVINIPVAIVAGGLALRVVSEQSDAKPGGLDALGQLLGSTALGVLAYAAIAGRDDGFGSSTILGLFAIGLLAVAAFVVVERRGSSPVLPPALFADRSFTVANLAGLAMGFVLFGLLFVFAIFFQQAQGHSAASAGARFLPLSLAFVLVGPIAGRMMARAGARTLMTGGLALVGAGCLLLVPVDTGTTYWYVGLVLAVIGVGYGMTSTPMAAVVMSSAPARLAGVASSVNNTARQAGGVFGVAVLGSLLLGGAGDTVDASSLSSGLHSALLIAGVTACIVAVLAGVFVRDRGREQRTEASEERPSVADVSRTSDSAPTMPRETPSSPDETPTPPTVTTPAGSSTSGGPRAEVTLSQSSVDAVELGDGGSPRRGVGFRVSRGLRVALSVAGLCVVVGVGLVLLLRGGGGSVTVYSSLPLQGPQRSRSEDMVRGMRLALKQADNKAGDFDVRFVSMDDATAETRGWDSSSVIANATRAAGDGDSAVYIGELNSGASALAIPVLSAAKVPQISASNTAVGLTTAESGADTGEPGKYYVGGFRNYVRLVPRDTIQGGALATLMKHDGCQRAAIVHDRDLYGEGLANNIRVSMHKQGLRRVLDEPFDARERAYHRTLASRLVLQRADCLVFSGDATSEAVRLFGAVGAALPRARLYGSDGVADRPFTDVNRGGLPEPLAARVKLTVPALGAEGFGDAGQTFFAQFRQQYPDHKNPDPYAIYGYEAMSLALDAIKRAHSTDREDIVKALFDTKDRSSVIGKYSIDHNGDTTLSDYGVFEIRDGAPIFKHTIKPPPR